MFLMIHFKAYVLHINLGICAREGTMYMWLSIDEATLLEPKFPKAHGSVTIREVQSLVLVYSHALLVAERPCLWQTDANPPPRYSSAGYQNIQHWLFRTVQGAIGTFEASLEFEKREVYKRAKLLHEVCLATMKSRHGTLPK
jgi:hypothetical protein